MNYNKRSKHRLQSNLYEARWRAIHKGVPTRKEVWLDELRLIQCPKPRLAAQFETSEFEQKLLEVELPIIYPK